MDKPDIELAATTQDGLDVRIRAIDWRKLSFPPKTASSGEWNKCLLDSGLLVEGSRAAADAELTAGDPRREIVGVHRLMRDLMATEERHDELKNPGPWNSGAVRLGATSIVIVLGLLYFTGISHQAPVATASLVCLAAVVAMWGDILWRKKAAGQEWQKRLRMRDLLRTSVERLGTRSWVAPLGREVLENTPHLELLRAWKREVHYSLAPWQARLDALIPLEDIEGLPAELIDDAQVDRDPAAVAEARRNIERLSGAMKHLEDLEQDLVRTLEAHRKVAATGALPTIDGLGFDLDEVRGWLRSAGLDPSRSGESAQAWLARATRS